MDGFLSRVAHWESKPQYLESYVYLAIFGIHEPNLGVRPGMAVARFIRLVSAQSASIGSEKGNMMERIPFVIWRIITSATFPRVGIGRGIITPAVPPLAALVD